MGVLDLVEIGIVGRRIPLEERRVVDEVLHQEVVGVVHEARGLGDLVERGDRRPEDVEHREGELALLGRVEEADVAQRPQRRSTAGRRGCRSPSPARRRCDSVSKIFIWSAVECMSTTSVMSGWNRFSVPFGALGVEGAGRDVVGDEIVEQRPRHGRLADAALVRADQDDCRLCHTHPSRPNRRGIALALAGNMAERHRKSHAGAEAGDISPILTAPRKHAQGSRFGLSSARSPGAGHRCLRRAASIRRA